MNQQGYQKFDPKAIETLKAARNQVIHADKGGSAIKSMTEGQNPIPRLVHDKFAPLETHNKELNGKQSPSNTKDKFLTGFAEEFVQKLTSIEKEKAAVDEEMANVEKLWSSLVEKKKTLENRRNELIKIKDRLKELDKEMSSVLKYQSI